MVFSKKVCKMKASMKKDMNCMKKKQFIWMILLSMLLMLILACGGTTTDGQGTGDRQGDVPGGVGEADEISIVTPEPDLHRDELNAILMRVTMLDGVSINGVDVSGMTKEEAKNAVSSALSAKKNDLSINVTFGDASEVFSAETVKTDDDLDAVITEAFSIVREDIGFDAVSAEVERIKKNGMDFPVHLSFNESALNDAVNAFADAHEMAPVNACISYNKEENKIDYTPDVPGRKVNREALFSALLDAEGGETLEAPAEEIPAEVTLKDIQEKYVLRSTYTTKYSKSNKNRKENIRHGTMDLLTGTIVHPGDVFSMNECLGVRKKDGHWKIATAFQAGKHVKEYGGGVCQISTTLYNAAVMSDMEIVFRQNHSMPVDYVDKGRDATINSIGNIIDFKFKNSSKSDIIIIGNADGKTLTIEIWGIPLVEDSNGEYDEIRIPTPKKIKTLKPTGEVLYQIDETKPVGYKEEVAKKRDGSVWESKKEYYLNGVLVKTEDLATSTYKAYAGEYIVGPSAGSDDDKTPQPSDSGEKTPKPTDSGTKTPKPTDPGTKTPKPTDPPENTPKPTDPPENTPKPTDPPEDTPKPTDPPEDTPKPTDPPTDPPADPPDDPPSDDDSGE